MLSNTCEFPRREPQAPDFIIPSIHILQISKCSQPSRPLQACTFTPSNTSSTANPSSFKMSRPPPGVTRSPNTYEQLWEYYLRINRGPTLTQFVRVQRQNPLPAEWDDAMKRRFWRALVVSQITQPTLPPPAELTATTSVSELQRQFNQHASGSESSAQQQNPGAASRSGA